MTKFSLAERNQLRPLLATLTSEGLIKVSRGFYCEPKLIQAYKASEGFDVAKIAKLANPGKEPPTNSENSEHEIPPSFSEVGKVGNLGKNNLNKLLTQQQVKSWCLAQRSERSEISLEALTKFIKEELGQEQPQRVIEEAYKQNIIMPSPSLGKAVVI
jgi:hypothetical protein